ncbi:peptidoglycan DD-metalloendopeptidase family protein [Micromonospora sp. NPDC049679]|uniref:golvesin C-terminal-like domain-containing protein n=1 Tax=Micromonospora sp. NPDC049679 TaxID=3155920 RepID=UPI0033FF9FB7
MRRSNAGRYAFVALAALLATIVLPPGPAAAATVTVDNSTAGRFTASNDWHGSAWSSQRYGPGYKVATPYKGRSDAAWYKMNIPSTGRYAVEVWYPADRGYNDKTPYVISTTSGKQSVLVNQRLNGGRWVRLGTFSLAGGNYNTVGVSRWTTGTGYVVADAVRVVSASTAPSVSLPLPRTALSRSAYDDPHWSPPPAIDLPVPNGTRAYAVRAGRVARLNDSGCGIGINLTGTDGVVYTYCHLMSWSVANGSTVTAGQQIGLTDNSGNSTGPHLHFSIRTGNTYRCPQNFLLAIYDGRTPPAPSSLPTTGCS